MKKQIILVVGGILALNNLSLGQSRYPSSVEDEDLPKLKAQSSAIGEKITPLVQDISKSVVRIVKPVNAYTNKLETLSNGTVTEKGIVVKWSEVEPFRYSAFMVNAEGKSSKLKLVGIYENYDLALFENVFEIAPISFENIATPELGDFLVLATSGGKPAGFGAVSVLERSLREEDKAFLGIQMGSRNQEDKGVLIEQVVNESSAAKAGIKAGDRIMSVDGEILESFMQTSTVIQNFQPGQKVKIGIDRAGEKLELQVVLGAKKESKKVPAKRMEMMENMGRPINEIRNYFPSSIQSDMMVDSSQMAGPVINLDGKLIGLTLSRSRIKTHIIPADDLRDLLENAPKKVQPQVAAHRDRSHLKKNNLKNAEQMQRMIDELLKMNSEMEKLKRQIEEEE